jgi:hypothetical protein
MMAMSMSATYTGRVVSVNPKGLKLDGHDDWYNVSKFATDVILPERGDLVTVVVDGKGFLRAVQPIDGPAPIAGASDQPRTAQAPSAPSQRDVTITRLAVLKAAAEFAAARPGVKSGEVLKIAESWERWVLRSDDPADELEEAF